MKTKSIIQSVCLLLIILGFNIDADSAEHNQADKPAIYVSIPPLAFLVEQICGADCNVITIIGPGQSPATFETTPKQMIDISKSVIYFTAGVPFEKQLNKKLKSSFENINIVDTQKGIELQKSEHHHGEVEEETEYLDPHTWLDPSLAKVMARNINDELLRIFPEDSLTYQKNLSNLLEKLGTIDSTIRAELKPYANRQFYCFHPAFGYFARVYNLKQRSIEYEGKEPSARQLADIIEKIKKEQVKIIFTQSQFSDKSARAIAKSAGAVVIPIDPLSKDYLINLKEITRQLLLAFEGTNND